MQENIEFEYERRWKEGGGLPPALKGWGGACRKVLRILSCKFCISEEDDDIFGMLEKYPQSQREWDGGDKSLRNVKRHQNIYNKCVLV